MKITAARVIVCSPGRNFVTLKSGESPVHGVDIDEKLAAKYPYQRAYLPVNRLQHDGTLWSW